MILHKCGFLYLLSKAIYQNTKYGNLEDDRIT